ncbi:MAG: division plane positioning ATPase MipZ [Alphaproteobacteria bacterium]
MDKNNAHIVVVGNEKGGTGKSTISMHLIVSLLRSGLKVGSIDLDGKQRTLTHYIQNRVSFVEKSGVNLPIPEHIVLKPSEYNDEISCKKDEQLLEEEIKNLAETCDVIIIDVAGSDNHLFRAGHRYADTLITPINDSLLDLDVIAKINPDTLEMTSPSHYAEKVWQAKKERVAKGLKTLNWFVIRNRLFHVESKNKKQMEKLLKNLSKRLGFSWIAGMGERVIFRELFLKGLTISDIRDKGININLSISNVAARQEIRNITDTIFMCINEQLKKSAS